ncbi:MAG: hypothetical protein WAK01_07960 [Methylocystis sp.]
MSGPAGIWRRRLAQASVAACALLAAATPARAEEQQPLSGRVMQWFGVGGDASKDLAPPPEVPKPAAASPAAAPATEPLSEGTYIPGANVVIVGGGPMQNRVLKMMGLTGGDEAPDGAAAAETAQKKALASGITECPDIVFDGSGAEMRSPADADASSVAYQLSITRTARECALAGENVSMRVGVLGAAMLGPVGKPGDYFGTVHIAVRRKSDNKLFGDKTYRVGAKIAPSQSRADFTLLVEDLSAPFVNAKAADDYEILLGFTSAANDAAKKRPKKKAGG